MTAPKFTPKPGQTDFTNARYCPVVNTVVVKGDHVLLVKRSSDLKLYPNVWNGVSGFLDDQQSIEDKVAEEIAEELGITSVHITDIRRGRPLLQEAPDIGKTWLVVPVLATIDTDSFQLDWEAEAAKWYTPAEVRDLQLLPGFIDIFNQFFPKT